MDAIIDFIRVRQINVALAGLLILGYLCYQFGGLLMKPPGECDYDLPCSRTEQRNRSRSKSRSPATSRSREKGPVRRRRSPRCPSCGNRFE